jgi:hypothetical protein
MYYLFTAERRLTLGSVCEGGKTIFGLSAWYLRRPTFVLSLSLSLSLSRNEWQQVTGIWATSVYISTQLTFPCQGLVVYLNGLKMHHCSDKR